MTQRDWNRRIVALDKALALMPTKVDGTVAWGGLKVAHLDTGYSEHPALGFAAGASPWVKPELGRDFFDNRKSPKDPLIATHWQPAGHGTRTASVLSADLAAADGTVVMRGLAPRVPTVPYRVNDDSLIFTRSVTAIGKAIRHAIDENGCQLVTISLGFPVIDLGDMGAAVDYAYENGVIVVAACGQMTDKISYPARHRRAIGVGGFTNRRKVYWKYERYGRVDIFAPAQPVFRATTEAPGQYTYGDGDGTSFAVPHVVAAAAMWLTLRGPEIRARYKGKDNQWMKVEAFRKLLRDTQARPPFKRPVKDRIEAGMLDAAKLVEADLPPPDALRYEEDLAEDDRV